MDLIDKVIKSRIKDLERIKDTFDERFEYVRLDKNERIVPFEPKVLDGFRRAITSEDISGYTELGPLYRKVASYTGADVPQLFFASGSDLAIKSVYEACVEEGDNVVLHTPSFAMYSVYAKMFGAEINAAPVRQDWGLDAEGMLRLVNAKTKIFAVENPNGFIGTRSEPSLIEHCAAELNRKNIIFLIDEAYYFIEHTSVDTVRLISKYPNVVISQTFSKCHGLAGARFGYLIGDERLIRYIARVRPMHEITGLTARAVSWILDRPEALRDYQKMVAQSKGILIRELKKLGIDCRDTHANFVMAYFPDSGSTKDIAQRLKDKKILIKKPFGDPPLKCWTRVTVGSSRDADVFIKAVKDITGA